MTEVLLIRSQWRKLNIRHGSHNTETQKGLKRMKNWNIFFIACVSCLVTKKEDIDLIQNMFELHTLLPDNCSAVPSYRNEGISIIGAIISSVITCVLQTWA